MENITDYREVMKASILWLAIATGVVTGVTSALTIGGFFVFIPALVVVGAITQRLLPSPGKWLLWTAAALLTISCLPVFGQALLQPQQFATASLVGFVFTVSAVLICVCDVALVYAAFYPGGRMQASHLPFPRKAARLVGRLVIWCIAIVLSVWIVTGFQGAIYSYVHYQRLDILVLVIVYCAVIAAFDIALVAEAVKAFRGRRATSGS